MTPETRLFLEKAHRLLAEADAMLKIGLNDALGRTAYLAGFHAAQAFISAKRGKFARTHKGVHLELYRLTKDDPGFDPTLRAFLSRTYNLKSLADYETGPASEVSASRATLAIEQAKRFVGYFDDLLTTPPSEPDNTTA